MEDKLEALIKKVINKQASSAEIEELSSYLSDSQIKQRLFDLYNDKWGHSSDELDMSIQMEMWNQIKKSLPIEEDQTIEVKPALQKRRIMQWAGAAAIALVLICSGIYFLNGDGMQQNQIVSVDRGQKAKIELPDGTHIWLNSASSIIYAEDYNKKNRTVKLDGEAYFEVAKDKNKPFIVDLGDMSVEVLGTTFNVKAYKEDSLYTTTLIEGAVRVANSSQAITMVPNEKVVFNKKENKMQKSETANAEYSHSWYSNDLAFDQESLSEIAKTLERMYNVSIVFETEDIRKVRFSGRVKNNNLEGVLQLISFVAPIKFAIDDSVVTIKKDPNNYK